MLKKINFIFLLLLVLIIELNAENKLHIGLSVGLAIPNEKVSQFYDDARQRIEGKDIDTFGMFLLKTATNIGYNIQIQGRVSLSNNFTFVPTIGLSRFNEGIYELVPLGIDTVIAKTQSTANIVPISVGINGHLFKKFISPYLNANLCYNYISYTYDIFWTNDISIPIATSTTQHRLGYSVGAGIDIDLSLVSLNLEAKFNSVNIIKYDNEEPTKQYFTFSLGIIF
ncbi:MAG: outer membrane beta-barrel protein [Bacteroidetes bacterium]|nr:outer membrane beta-barrel protein [Bacteroidota bacterium]